MGFSLANGLSAMGGAISQTAGAMALEQQRSELDMQKTELANMLAGQRESAGRKEEHGFRTVEQKARFDHETGRDTQQHGQRMEEIKEGHRFRLDEISAQSKAQINAAWARRGMEEDDLNWIETDEDGNKFGVTKSGSKVDLGIKGPNSADEKLLARAERFATEKKTTVDPETQEKLTEEVINPTKAAQFLKRQNREDLAKGYETPPKPAAPSIPSGVPLGSQYSPSRRMWRDPQGKLYDQSGKPVAGAAAEPAPAAAPKRTASIERGYGD